MIPDQETDDEEVGEGEDHHSTAQTEELNLETLYRLPTNIKPHKYSVTVGFDIPRRRYQGSVDISLSIYQESSSIYLNSKNLELWSVYLVNYEDLRFQVSKITLNNTLGVCRLDLDNILPAGDYTLHIEFSGNIRIGLQGVYLNRYTGKDGSEKEGVATMFAATEARSFMPCWDQPDMKAVFELEVLVQHHFDVFSNMYVVLTNPESALTNPESVLTNPESVLTNPDSVLTNPESVLTRRSTVQTSTDPVKASSNPVQTSKDFVQTGADFVEGRPSSISRSQEPVLSRINSVEVSPDCSSYGRIWNKLTQTGLKSVKFAPTPRMSTYLLCFVIGEYSRIQRSTLGTTVGVISPLNRIDEGEYALNLAVKCLEIFKNYFGVPYSLPKLDLIAISCISVGAMENWGLITFREQKLLVNPSTASSFNIQSVALTIAHEISHQWFGNLMTMVWWSDLWLNEGFATFMQYLAVDIVHPELKVWDQFCSDVMVTSLKLDAHENSHPIKVEVENPLQIDEIFDKISYMKGASIIWMLYNLIGEDDFNHGIQKYVKRFSFANARTEDLWDCLGEYEGAPVSQIMDSWVSCIGFPLVEAELRVEEGTQFIMLKQQPFSSLHKTNINILWQIPIQILIKPSRKENPIVLQTFLFKEKEALIPITCSVDLSRGGFVKLNTRFISYFRSVYSVELSEALDQGLVEKQLCTVDRLSTLEENIALVLGSSAVNLLVLVFKLKDEDEFLVWANIASFFNMLQCIVWSNEEISEKFDRYVISVLEPCLDRLGWTRRKDDDYMKRLLRSLVISELGIRGCTKVYSRCKKWLDIMILKTVVENTEEEWEPGLKEAVMRVCMAQGDSHKVLDSLLLLLDDPSYSSSVLLSIGFSTNPDVIQRVLELSLSPKLRDQEAVIVIECVCKTRVGYRKAWDFFKLHFNHFYERYGHGLFLMSKLIKCVTESFSTEDGSKEVTEFFDTVKYIGCERTILQVKENIGLNRFWREKDILPVSTYLNLVSQTL